MNDRIDSLEKIGVEVNDESRSATYVLYHFTIHGKRSSHLSIKLGGFLGADTLMFLDSWDRLTHENAITATAAAEWDIERERAILRIMNIGLLQDVAGEMHLTKEEFFDALWNKIIRTIEQLARWI